MLLFNRELTVPGMAILSALVVFFFVKPLTHDGMIEEDVAVSELLFDDKLNDSSGNL
jgi:hypothetical protein